MKSIIRRMMAHLKAAAKALREIRERGMGPKS
jgi:hypothetical protein